MNRSSFLLAAALIAVLAGADCGYSQDFWQPYVELEGRAGSARELVQGNLFVPIFQDDSQMLFADVRAQWTDVQSAETNVGLAIRRQIDHDLIFGFYGFYDFRHTRANNDFEQATVGIELLSVNWGLRLNGYAPDRKAKQVGPLTQVFERAYHGLDFEMEGLLWSACGGCCNQCGSDVCDCQSAWWECLDAELWATAGVFYFDNATVGYQDMTGPRASIELRFYDLAWLGNDSRLVFTAQIENDDVRGTVATAMATVRIPFGWGGSSRPGLYGLDRRMVAPIVRDIDIITNTNFGYGFGAGSAPGINIAPPSQEEPR